jgi:hypothetical protein
MSFNIDYVINESGLGSKSGCSESGSESGSEIENIMDEIEFTFNLALESASDTSASDRNNDDNSSTTTISSSSNKQSWIDAMSHDDLHNLEYTIIDMMNDYIEYDIENMYMGSFEEDMIKNIMELVAIQLNGMDISVSDDDPYLEDLVQNLYNELSETNPALIKRSRQTFTPNMMDESEKQMIDTKIEALYNNEGQKYKQRTNEWYEYRAGLITASNLWKIFSSSQSVQNSLIYEKCKPFVMSSSLTQQLDDDTITVALSPPNPSISQVNTCTPFHWGNKYESLSIKIYERKYETRVAEFGCIRHPAYSFIGASPDGINMDRNSPRYGRMIEVKNIYNREITGIPKDEYWIQMQFQMETCGLTECDFIETRFKEYNSESEFYENEFVHDTRGVILYFVERESMIVGNINPHYVYMPIDNSLEKEQVDRWISNTKDSMKNTHHLYEIQYWYLDEFSCVLVELNKLWIQCVIPKVEFFWNLICKEKITGYDHRSAKKRTAKEKDDTLFSSNSNKICLIKLDSDGNPL